MKKLSKRFLTLAIACVMAMMMAVPAFAIGNPTVSSGRYKIYQNGKTTFLLNVRGYGNENDNVTLYTPTNGNDQVWKTIATSYGGFYVVSALSNTQGLNIYHGTNNCQLHSYVGNTTDGKSDCIVNFRVTSHTINLRDWPSYYLTFASLAANANVYWSSSQSSWGWAATN